MAQHTICLLNDSFPPTIDGVANAVLNYAGIIEESYGHSIVVTPYVSEADDSSYPFDVVRYPSIDTRKLFGYVTGYPFSPDAAHTIEEQHAEVLHTHCPVTSCLLARQLAQSMQIPLIMTYHTKYDIDIANAVRSKHLQKGALTALLRNINACDEIWAVSKGAGENLMSMGYEGEYVVMRNGVDLPREKAAPELVLQATEGYDLPENIPCFLFIGRLMWYKGLKIILDALKQLDHKNIDFRMVFVGSGGDEAEVTAYTSELQLDRKVFFTGAISNRELLRAWYTRADLFLFPSTFDTNGLVVREAAASDTASVIIAGSCAAEGITDDRNGFLIEENADSLAAKLSALIASPDHIRQVGANAGAEIYLSWKDAIAQAYERYEIVIDRYKSGFYRSKVTYDNNFLRYQGNLMQSLGDLEASRKELHSSVKAFHAETRNSLQSMKNEARQNLDELWEKFERYL